LTVRVAIAQCAPALGAFKRNVAMHEEWIGRAQDAHARLVVFPELSLTGYYLKDLAGDIACAADDERLKPIADASRRIDVCAGFVERASDARLHIAQGYWSGGRLVHVHRKVYATTGATVLISPSSSPGRGVAEGGDLGTAESCRLMDRFYAQYLTLYVLFVNRVGLEDGIAFWGGSEVVAPDGTVVARAPDFEEHLLIAEIDPGLVARERDRNPLIRDERPDLVQSHLARRTGLVRVADVAAERS
jgi:predicted amidohydrolase